MNALFALLVAALPSTQEVPLDSPRWDHSAADATRVEHLGRDSLHLLSGTLLLRDTALRNGVIEFDVALPEARGFIGVVWRAHGPGHYEHFYLRPHQSGNPDACQYTPVFHGISGWQLYAGEGYALPLVHRFDEWTPVRVEFWEGEARVSVGAGQPQLVIDTLQAQPQEGDIGLSAGFAAAHFSRIRYRALEAPSFELRGEERSLASSLVPAGFVPSWSVSSTFAEASLAGAMGLADEHRAGLTWDELPVEPSGLANLARVQGIGPGQDTCFARALVGSPREQIVLLDLGFSDRARVYLNGRLLYAGDNSYLSRDYRYLGTIGTFDRVALPLVEGTNELMVAVSEGFGGWGLIGRLPLDAALEFE